MHLHPDAPREDIFDRRSHFVTRYESHLGANRSQAMDKRLAKAGTFIDESDNLFGASSEFLTEMPGRIFAQLGLRGQTSPIISRVAAGAGEPMIHCRTKSRDVEILGHGVDC